MAPKNAYFLFIPVEKKKLSMNLATVDDGLRLIWGFTLNSHQHCHNRPPRFFHLIHFFCMFALNEIGVFVEKIGFYLNRVNLV